MLSPGYFVPRLRPYDIGWKSGDERLPIGVGTWASVAPHVAAKIYAFPFFTPHPLKVASVNVGLVTGQTGAECMIGIYGHNRRGRAGRLIEDLGTIDLSGGAGTGKLSATATCRVFGFFWVRIHMKNVATQATMRSAAGGTTSSFWLPIGSTGLVSSAAGRCFLVTDAAYPANMPAVAEADAPTTLADNPLPTVIAA